VSRLSALLFGLAVSAATWFLTANLFLPGLDEGIYLSGGQRMASGQIPYRDFFAFTGPLIYWQQALSDRVFGANIALARIPVALAAGTVAGFIAVLGRHLAGTRAGILAGLLWWALSFGMYVRYLVNHRWLSSAFLSLAGIFLLYPTARNGVSSFAAGVALGLSVVATPSFVLPLLLTAGYLLYTERRNGLALLAGAAVPGAATLFWLLATGSLNAFLANLAWIQGNYSGANIVPFAFVVSDVFNRNVVASLTGPVLTVVAALAAAWLGFARRQHDLRFPLIFSLGLLATAYPRLEAMQLLFVTAPFFALAVALAFRNAPVSLHPSLTSLLIIPSAFFLFLFVSQRSYLEPIETRVGTQLAPPETLPGLEKLHAAVPAGSKVFVFPYLSSLYYLLQAKNPTRYEYLQPGMMGGNDETRVLDDLDRNPPDIILWQELPDHAILKAWPNSDPAKMRFPRIENFIRANYRQVDEARAPFFSLAVWKRN
jgi:hypothetical protein